jgi:hypothetical protein
MYISDLQLTITPASALYTSPVPDSALTVNESVTQGRTSIILDFNNSEGLYARDLGTIFQWPISAGTVLEVWQPSIIPLDEDRYQRMSFHFLIKDLGGVGWNHVREMNVPYTSSAALTLLLTFDNGAVPSSVTLTLPSSGGTPTKLKVTMPPNKWKQCEGFLSSTQPFLLRDTDLEMKVRSWGSAEAYRVVKPFSG